MNKVAHEDFAPEMQLIHISVVKFKWTAPFSVQQPRRRTTLGCGSSIFIMASSLSRSLLWPSVALLRSVLTATVTEAVLELKPGTPSVASYFHTCPKQPSPILETTFSWCRGNSHSPSLEPGQQGALASPPLPPGPSPLPLGLGLRS